MIRTIKESSSNRMNMVKYILDLYEVNYEIGSKMEDFIEKLRPDLVNIDDMEELFRAMEDSEIQKIYDAFKSEKKISARELENIIADMLIDREDVKRATTFSRMKGLPGAPNGLDLYMNDGSSFRIQIYDN